MFGGIAFMASGHMCCGVVNDTLMAQVGASHYEAALKKLECLSGSLSCN
jgi:hypothetical protein